MVAKDKGCHQQSSAVPRSSHIPIVPTANTILSSYEDLASKYQILRLSREGSAILSSLWLASFAVRKVLKCIKEQPFRLDSGP